MLTFDKISLDVYVMPHELHGEQEQISRDVAGMVQAFCSEFALPHLHCFTKCCCLEGVKPFKHCCMSSSLFAVLVYLLTPPTVSANLIWLTGPQHLPPPVDTMGSRLQCSAVVPEEFSKSIGHAGGTKSMVLQEAGQTMNGTVAQTPTICKQRLAEAFTLCKAREDSELVTTAVTMPPQGEKKLPPLISIRPCSDAILDRLRMEDQTLLWLHILLGTVRSSHWETTLVSREWGLNASQASALATALLKDVQGLCNYTITVVKVCNPSQIFLTLLTLSIAEIFFHQHYVERVRSPGIGADVSDYLVCCYG